MSGRKSRSKGQRRERELVAELKEMGFEAERVPLSGAAGGSFKHDVIVYLPSRDERKYAANIAWGIEVKSRKNGWKEIHDWLDKSPDLLMLKADHKDWLVVMRLSQLRELL